MTSEDHDEYILPAAHYEAAVICWNEGCLSHPDAACGDQYRRKKTQECLGHLETVSKWDLECVNEGGIKQRAQMGIETVKWLKEKKGWA